MKGDLATRSPLGSAPSPVHLHHTRGRVNPFLEKSHKTADAWFVRWTDYASLLHVRDLHLIKHKLLSRFTHKNTPIRGVLKVSEIRNENMKEPTECSLLFQPTVVLIHLFIVTILFISRTMLFFNGLWPDTGSVTEWSACWTRNPVVPGSSPALTTTWICFSAVAPNSNPRPLLEIANWFAFGQFRIWNICFSCLLGPLAFML